jgi:redox-sensitive bicupin YhaK (pirin superfamily)
MIQLRRSEDRGHAEHGWLDARHSFSFAEYHDPRHMSFSALRVLNEDRVAPGAGFPTHPHQDMEILTYLLDGTLEHRDSLGNGSVIRVGDIQRMSAGTGVRHSEANPSATEPTHLLQIWLRPHTLGLPPSYEQQHLEPDTLRNRLRLIASPDGRDGSVTIHQDAFVYAARLDDGATVTHALAPDRRAYVHIARGNLRVNGEALAAGDGARLEHETRIELAAAPRGEVLLFDLP